MTTGVPHAPIAVENAKPGAPNDWPSLGALVRKVWPRPTPLPAAVTLPEQSANDGNLTWPGQDGGFLGRAADPWLIDGDPNAPAFRIAGLTPPPDLPPARLAQRQSLRELLDNHRTAIDRTGEEASRARQAFDLIASPAARRAFDLDAEPARVRDRYGRTRFGQSCLLARRLVEAGVPLVRVNWTRVAGAPNNGHWDTHQKNTEGVKALMPILDRAYGALLDDLTDRGLLDSTLVMWTGEFGRTPKINPAGGRDHHPGVWTIIMGGGPLQGGRVVGESDELGYAPKSRPVTPGEVAATVFRGLGLDPHKDLPGPQGRPLPLAEYSLQPIKELF
jgi:hypothetical protein